MKTNQVLFILIFSIIADEWSWALGSPKLIVSNDGPIVQGASITFNATLEDFTEDYQLFYKFDDGVNETIIQTKDKNVLLSRACSSDLYATGVYNMTIIVKKDGFIWDPLIVSNYSIFNVKSDLVISIGVYQGANSSEDATEVAVGENVTMRVIVFDPSGYLENAVFDYSWSIDGERYQTLAENGLLYNFSDPGTKEIKAVVTATIPNVGVKYGFFDRQLTVKVPVNNINITGNPFLRHGEILHLNVSCNGSSPFEYCWQIMKTNESSENFSCSQLSTFTTCQFHILHYFQNYGTYNIGIYISNDVKNVKRIMEVMVYNVSTKPTLSTVIIPIVCSLLTLIIIAGGIAYYIQRRHHLAIEVANFDFQEESDSYSERTFFEQIFDNFSCRACSTQNQIGTDGDFKSTEEDPLLRYQPLERI